MLSNELNALAAQLEGAARVRSTPTIDPVAVAKKLRILAMGVSALEAVTMTDTSRVIPAGAREHAMRPRPVAEAAVLLAQTAHLAEEVQS
jgi:hypothetical protein